MSSGEPDASSVPELDVQSFVRSLFAGLATADKRLVRHAGYLLCQRIHANEEFRGAGIDALVAWAVRRPHQNPVLRTLATLLERHEAEIKQRLLAATDRRRARVLYDRLLTTRRWEVDLDQESEQTVVKIGDGETVRIPTGLVERHASNQRGNEESTTAENTHLKTTSPVRDREWSHFSRLERLERMPNGESFVAIEEKSQFDEIEFLGPELETRYGNVVQTRTLAGTVEDIVILRLYHQQEDPDFQRDLTEQLELWSQLDNEGVVGLADWGSSPRPWVAAEYTEGTLREQGQLQPELLLQSASELTAALAELHQRDVVHGGIDPHSIRVTPAMFDEPSHPKFDNVGLIPVYRQYDNPASYTDPRYAAPEYFADQYGGIDHATDIYQLGLAIYTACTGEPPYEGSVSEIRKQILTEGPTGMGSEHFPGSLGDVLTRATAREKMQRFETATQFHKAIRSVAENL